MNSKNDDLKPEYDFSQGTRGKYVSRLTEGANIVVLDSDVASVFPDSADALRVLAQIIQSSSGKRPSRRAKYT